MDCEGGMILHIDIRVLICTPAGQLNVVLRSKMHDKRAVTVRKLRCIIQRCPVPYGLHRFLVMILCDAIAIRKPRGRAAAAAV